MGLFKNKKIIVSLPSYQDKASSRSITIDYKIDLSKTANNDRRDIVRYISSQLSAPTSALHMMTLLEEAMTDLSDMPQRCSQVADPRLAQMGFRKLIVKNDAVFFSIDEKNKVVNIERVLYGRRDWLKFL
ncbi:MAG: type II toxin-antitoxin system RelE/ParE family toxin [Sporolactobacillus sp.]